MSALGVNDAAPLLRVSATDDEYVEGGAGYRILVGREGGSESRTFLGLPDDRLHAITFAVTADDEGWTVEVPRRVRYQVFVAGVDPEAVPVRVARSARYSASIADISVWTPGREHRVRLEWTPASRPASADFVDRMAEQLASGTVNAGGLLDAERTDDRALILCCVHRVQRVGEPPATDAQILALIGQENTQKNRERLRGRLKRTLPDVCYQRFQIERTEFERTYGRTFTRIDAVEYLVRTGQVTQQMVDRALAIERAAAEQDDGEW